MPAYRAKAIQIDAEQILGRDVNVSTRRGLVTARNGDWIVHDALGVAEVLDGEAFSKRYEPVPEGEVAPAVSRGEPDPATPRDAPREDVPPPPHLEDYLTGRSDEMPGEVGAPGDPNLTEAEAREAAKEPDERPVVGSEVVLPNGDSIPIRPEPEPVYMGPGEEEREEPKPATPKNKGGRPKGSASKK